MTGFSMRGLTLGVVAALTIALGPAGAAAAAPRTRLQPAIATLSASPHRNLADGQPITVTASGYPANSSLDLVQCVQDRGCDFSELFVLDSGDHGGYTTTFFAHRMMQLDDGVQVDCADAQDCVLVSLDITDLSTGAQTPLNFDPDSPLAPPLHFRVAADPTGKVRLDRGVARITGTVHCNQEADIQADVKLEQTYHSHIFKSEQLVDMSCSGDTRFALVFRPVNGLFGEGTAKFSISASGNAGSSSYDLSKAVTLTLVHRT
jgi:Neocarzinostatin family